MGEEHKGGRGDILHGRYHGTDHKSSWSLYGHLAEHCTLHI